MNIHGHFAKKRSVIADLRRELEEKTNQGFAQLMIL
jgi:hypothetical protein